MRQVLRVAAGVAMGLGVVALASAIATAIPGVSRFIDGHGWLTRGDVIQFVFLACSLALMAAFSKGRVSLYGLRGTGGREIRRVLVVAGGVAVVIGLLSAATWMAGARPEGGPLSDASGFLKIVVSIWIVASVSEEMLFRGFIQGYLQPLRAHGFRFFGRRLSLPVTVAAVGFGLIHLGLMSTAPPPMVATIVVTATILGFIAGYYRERTGSIVPAVLAHVVFNALGSGIPMVASLIVSG